MMTALRPRISKALLDFFSIRFTLRNECLEFSKLISRLTIQALFVTSLSLAMPSSAVAAVSTAGLIYDFKASAYNAVNGVWTNSGSVGGTTTRTANTGVTFPSKGSAPATVEFNGSTNGYQFITSQSYANPQAFTLNVWFRTSSTGGKIVGFENSTGGTGGSSYDRMLYIGSDGKLYFGVYPGSIQTIATAGTVTDNVWRHVVATFASNVMTLYVDGSQVGTLNSGAAQDYTGYWRIGGYKLTSWNSATGDSFFSGELGQVSIYTRALSSTEASTSFQDTKIDYAPLNSTAPAISGTTTVGEILTASTGTWANSPTSYAYQWSRAASSGGIYSNISGATSSAYTLAIADVGQFLKFTVTATNSSGSTASSSLATSQILKIVPTFSTWSNVSKTFGDANYTVTPPAVTGSLSGTFSYSSGSPSVISISGSTFSVAGGGIATITATFTPTDTSRYATATTTNSVTVNKAAQSSIAITSTAANYGTNLNLTSSGGSTGGTYIYTRISGNCTIAGSILTPTATGTCVVRSSLATDTNYLAEQSADMTVTIAASNVTASISLGAGTLIYRQVKILTAIASVAGKVTFKVNGKKLSGCINKTVSAPNSFTATCVYKPSTRGYIIISTTLDPTDTSYIGATTSSERLFVLNRSGSR